MKLLQIPVATPLIHCYQLFLEVFRPEIPSTPTFSVETLDGGTDPQSPSDAGVIAVSLVLNIYMRLLNYVS